jgi:predicted metal-dependent HD superfamily phosphohydrolase
MTAQELLSETWRQLAARHGVGAALAQAVLEELIGAYVEPARQYHTLEHIAALLRQLDEHGDGVIDHDAVALAILFHDVVYDARRQDNEQASAAVARQRLTALGFATDIIDKVAAYIEATQHGRKLDAVADHDLALLLDLDLSTLAAPPDVYRRYANAIRGEYAHVPDALYRSGRRQILDGFLARERIYRTERLHGLWEARARANLSEEIAGLR